MQYFAPLPGTKQGRIPKVWLGGRMEAPEAEPPRSSTVGTRIEALNEGGLWGRDVPFLPEEESGKRVVPLPRKSFNFELKKASFGTFWV